MSNQYPAYGLPQIVARLPAASARKYRALQSLVADAEALLKVSAGKREPLAQAVTFVVQRLNHLDPANPADADDIAAAKAELEALDADLAKLDQERTSRDLARGNAQQCLSQINAWLPTLFIDRDVALVPVAVEPTPKKGESLPDALMRTRRELAELKGQLAMLRAAPLPLAEIKAQVRNRIDALAREGRPTVMIDGTKVDLLLPDLNLYGEVNAPLNAPSGSASRLLAALFPEEMFKAATTGLVDSKDAVGSAERAGRERDLKASILAAEHEEEALVTACLDAGLDVRRSPYASPWSLLAVELPSAVALQAAE